MNIRISTRLYPTENSEKIIKALENIFPTKFKKLKSEIYVETDDINVLKSIRTKIEELRIKTTALYLLENNKTEEGNSRISLNKQTLMLGKIHFVEEEYSLGNVNIEFDDVDQVANYLSS